MTRKLIRRFSIPASLLMLAMVLGACQTTEGFGEDVQSAGEGIESTAEDVQD